MEMTSVLLDALSHKMKITMSCEAEELGLDVAFHCEEHIALLSFL
jgi:hypothetical protein